VYWDYVYGDFLYVVLCGGELMEWIILLVGLGIIIGGFLILYYKFLKIERDPLLFSHPWYEESEDNKNYL
jgi:hypothetical protein